MVVCCFIYCLPAYTEHFPLSPIAPFPPRLLTWRPGQTLCLPCGESVTLSVTALNAKRYEWILNEEAVASDDSHNIQVDRDKCGVYKCLVHNEHGSVHTPPIHISMSDDHSSSSLTAAVLKMTFTVDIIPGPSTSSGECVQ